jgi:hypothetical protein
VTVGDAAPFIACTALRRHQGGWGAVHKDVVPTLRCSAQKLWVTSRSAGGINRRIHPAELCLLQGYPPNRLPPGRQDATTASFFALPASGAVHDRAQW